MIRSRLLGACIASILILSACAGPSSSGSAEPQGESRSAPPAPSRVSPFDEGRVVFEAKCQECHALPRPGAHNVENWGRILDRMRVKARLTPREDALVRAYVIASAAWGVEPPAP